MDLLVIPRSLYSFPPVESTPQDLEYVARQLQLANPRFDLTDYNPLSRADAVRAHITETGGESYRFRRKMAKRKNGGSARPV